MNVSLPVVGTYVYKPPQVNDCGGCTECCYAVAVEEVAKPYFTHCKHQTHSRCKIHETKPASCAGYLCLYAAGFVDIRPDHLGFIFQMVRDSASGAFVLEVIETRDTSEYAFKRMNIPLNEVVRTLKVDCVKFFLFDTEIGTVFHTDYGKPDQYMQGGGAENWKLAKMEGFPPLLFYTRTKNTKTKAKLLTLLSAMGGGMIATTNVGMEGLKKLLGV